MIITLAHTVSGTSDTPLYQPPSASIWRRPPGQPAPPPSRPGTKQTAIIGVKIFSPRRLGATAMHFNFRMPAQIRICRGPLVLTARDFSWWSLLTELSAPSEPRQVASSCSAAGLAPFENRGEGRRSDKAMRIIIFIRSYLPHFPFPSDNSTTSNAGDGYVRAV